MTLSELTTLVCQESGLTLDALQGRGKPIRLANARSCLAILSLRFGPPRCGSALDRLLRKGDGVTRRLRADHGRRLEQVPSYRAIYLRCLQSISGASTPALALPSIFSPVDVRHPGDSPSPCRRDLF